MADAEDILNDDEFFGDVVDTSKEGIEHHQKREYLKSVCFSSSAYSQLRSWP